MKLWAPFERLNRSGASISVPVSLAYLIVVLTQIAVQRSAIHGNLELLVVSFAMIECCYYAV